MLVEPSVVYLAIDHQLIRRSYHWHRIWCGQCYWKYFDSGIVDLVTHSDKNQAATDGRCLQNLEGNIELDFNTLASYT